MSPPHLLHFRISHYNEKVRWALDCKGIAHTREALVPGFHIPRVRRLTGQNKVPVLVIDEKPIVESHRILEAIERRWPEPPLFPSDRAEAARVTALAASFDDDVAPDLRRLFWASYLDHPADAARMATDGRSSATRMLWRALMPVMRPVLRNNMRIYDDEVERTRRRLTGHFDRLAAAIGSSGYLVGDRFGAADLTAASIMSAIIRPPQFSYPLPEPLPPGLVELRASVAEHAAFRWVLDIFARHRGRSCAVS